MTTAQVVETSVTVTISSFQNNTHPDDHTRQTTDTPGFKSFTMKLSTPTKTKLTAGTSFVPFSINATLGPVAPNKVAARVILLQICYGVK